MTIKRTIRAAAIAVSMYCSMVLAGWAAGYPSLMGSFRPGYIPMMPITAVMFIMSAMIMFAVSADGCESVRKAFVSSLSLYILTITTVLGIIHVDTLLNVGHMPSPATMLCFALIGMRGLLFAFTSNARAAVCGIAFVIAGVSAMALWGYFFDIPQLYYRDGRHGGMAINTAAIFMVLSAMLFSYAIGSGMVERKAQGK